MVLAEEGLSTYLDQEEQFYLFVRGWNQTLQGFITKTSKNYKVILFALKLFKLPLSYYLQLLQIFKVV